MTISETMELLKGYGNDQTKKTYLKHGAQEPLYGVKVGDLKKILKKTKKNHELALELYATGNSDAMYLAGLMADEKKMTKSDLKNWIERAYWYYLSEYAVPWIAYETKFGFELGLEWIESDDENTAAAGWQTLSCISSIKADEELDLKIYGNLLDRAANTVHDAKNRVSMSMNAYIIAIGSNIASLTDKAMILAKKIGVVDVNMGDTACKVPLAKTYIQKVIDKNRIGRKRKTARC
ncbi:DNA alkylation repair protein [Aureispira]|nr:DNA alkylation repair protein [Aureispira sp.]